MDMTIKLDNLDRDDGSVLITCNDQSAARDDQSIAGSHWEAPGDMSIAYAIVCDHADLLADLEREGYSVDDSEYCAPENGES